MNGVVEGFVAGVVDWVVAGVVEGVVAGVVAGVVEGVVAGVVTLPRKEDNSKQHIYSIFRYLHIY